jgi:phosphoribosyl-ATP pyrophosphohydrolase/phosphoribosyl-AMP cyclohydrolase
MADPTGKHTAITADAIAFGHGTAPVDGPALVPAIVQDATTGEVLMLAWQSREALDSMLASGLATFWSRSRKALWTKGETSGNRQIVRGVAVDCDADAVLLQVDPSGPACHTGERTCFHRGLAGTPETVRPALAPLAALDATLEVRRKDPPEGSYVAKLYGDEAKRHKKIGEEGAELIVASLKGDRQAIVAEAADLLFHMLVVLRAHGLGLADVATELEGRAGAPRRE